MPSFHKIRITGTIKDLKQRKLLIQLKIPLLSGVYKFWDRPRVLFIKRCCYTYQWAPLTMKENELNCFLLGWKYIDIPIT